MRQLFKIFAAINAAAFAIWLGKAAIIGTGAYIFLAITLSDLRAADEKRPREPSAAEEQADFNKRPC